jgi:acetyl-CoA acetyltransferase family protein
MSSSIAAIPLNAAWSSPFVRWQGALCDINSIDLAVQVTGDALVRAGIPVSVIDSLVIGMTVPQRDAFYAATTIAAKIGAEGITGPILSQACATSVASLDAAASTVRRSGEVVLVVTTDRTSNGPTLTYPSSSSPGGSPTTQRWVLDSFERDPWGGTSMTATAEAVAAEAGITRSELDEVTATRYAQYQDSLANDRAFQQPWMIPVHVPNGKRAPIIVRADAGVHATTLADLQGLRALTPDGVVTFGGQTHPADGAAGMIVTTEQKARDLSGDHGIARILGTGFSRVAKSRMPKAPVPAAYAALLEAGLTVADVHAVKTHNPFAVNDACFARETGYAVENMNAFGCSLVYGHPQGPTGVRGIVELIEILKRRGGGIGLFTGCAAGDTGAAVVIEVVL